MNAFRALLTLMVIGIFVYTGFVGIAHGWNLFPVFFGDIFALTWPGQFNVDFSCFLILSGLWMAWRHHFSLGGLVLGVFGVVGGMSLLAPYLLFLSFRTKGDIKVMILGEQRAKN